LKLGLSGHVKNAVDGSVVIEVEGEEEAVNRFREWCRHGPRGAQVAHLECTEGAIQGFESFEITFY
jgi:acylphosphatase